MKPPLRIAFQPSIGLLIEEEQVAMSVTAATPRGRREVAREIQPCDEQSREEVLAKMLGPWVPPPGAKHSRPKPWVRVSLPEARVFQAAVPITNSNRQSGAQNYFLEAVQATNVRVEDRIVEMVKLELGDRSLACVAASPRVVIESSIEMMSRLGTRVGLIESSPASLYRAGAYYQRSPRKSKLCVRFFLGKTQAIGVLGAGAQPLFWQAFDLTPGDETTAILAAHSTLWMMVRHARITLPVDTVIIHGRPDLKLKQQQKENFESRTRARLIHCSQPGYDPAAAAFGLSLASISSDEVGLDLARTLKPPVTIRDIFPYGELVAHCALIGAASLFTIGVAAESSHRFHAVDGAVRAVPWLKNQDQAKLDDEKKTIQERLKAISSFRDSRVHWSGLLRKIAVTMPESTVITSVSGDAEIEARSGSGPARSKKKLVVSFETPLADNGSLPPEIDSFLAALRGDTTLKRQFPLIEVTGFKSNAGRQGGRASASYSIVCLPSMEKSKTLAKR